MLKQITTRRRIAYFLLYSSIIILIILAVTVGPETLRSIKHMQLRYIFMALGLFCLMTYFDILRIQILVRALGRKLSLIYTLKLILAYNFLSAITPALTGGEPLIVYMLKEKGLGVGKGTSVVVIRGILMIMFIAIGGPLIIYYHHELLPNLWFKRMFDCIAIFLLIITLFILYAIFSPLRAEHVLEKILHWLEKFKLFRKKTPDFIQTMNSWIKELNLSMKLFFKRRKLTLLWATLYTIAFICANYSLAYVILKGLNFNISIIKVFMVQFVLYFLLYFSPTPGGSGIAEGGFYVLFSPLLPQHHHILGVLIVLWRFFTVYLGVILGGVVIMKSFGIERLEELAKEKIKPVLDTEE
jgi:uncharacterized protein (TIRG00374 family)